MQYWSKAAHAMCPRLSISRSFTRWRKTGLWGEAVRQRRPVITNDYAAPNPLKRGTPAGHVPVVRHMNIPVFDGQRIVAVAGVGNKATYYEQRDVDQLQLLLDGWWRIVSHKRFELQLVEARRQAEVAKRCQEAASWASMSHEIRTPHDSHHGVCRPLDGSDRFQQRVAAGTRPRFAAAATTCSD